MERRRDDKADMLGAGVYTPDPEPPFQTLAPWLVYVTFRLDLDQVRQFVPDQLKLSSGNAQLALFESPTSWGYGPHSRAVLGVEVEEHDSPDTNKALFMAAQVISGKAFSIMSRHYGRAEQGHVRVVHNDGAVSATIFGPGYEVWVDVALRISGPLMPNNSGIDRYIGQTSHGLVQHDVAYSGTAMTCEIERLEFTPSAPPQFLACRPLSVHFAGVNPVFAGSYSVPWALTIDAGNPTLGSYLDLLDREGRAAAVFSNSGALVRSNANGASLLRQLNPSTVSAAIASSRDSDRPIQLSRPIGPPILAWSTAFRLPSTIDELQLVLLIDLAAQDARASAPFLRVLGLTHAECAVADLVGSGLSARDAACALGISQNTVRSTLKGIYAKLGIAKQSELARLVARLQF